MPINTIIIVALALIVLIVLIVMFTGRIGIFGKGLSQCNGFCATTASQCESAGAAAVPMSRCNDDDDPEPEGTYCCIRTS